MGTSPAILTEIKTVNTMYSQCNFNFVPPLPTLLLCVRVCMNGAALLIFIVWQAMTIKGEGSILLRLFEVLISGGYRLATADSI